MVLLPDDFAHFNCEGMSYHRCGTLSWKGVDLEDSRRLRPVKQQVVTQNDKACRPRLSKHTVCLKLELTSTADIVQDVSSFLEQ
jgi:hypothetical protein